MNHKHYTKFIYGLILILSCGCLPQKISPPIKNNANIEAAANLAKITEIMEYDAFLKKLSQQEINYEYKYVVESFERDRANPDKLIILSLQPSLTAEQLNKSSKLLARINNKTTFASASSKKLLTLLLNLAGERHELLAKIGQSSDTKKIQQRKINKNKADLLQCETKTSTLKEQIKKLEEIEKLIIKRKETDLHT